MPTYDYECAACGHTFELFQSIKAGPVKKCPACAKPRAKRLIGTGGGIIFRGSGFYCTDYRSDGYKSAAKAETGAAASKSNGDGAKPGDDGAKASSPSASSGSKSAGSTKEMES